MLFVCSECGDIGCGAITFRLTETDTTITWSDFGYDDSFEATSPYKNIMPFCFNKNDYAKLFMDLLSRE